MTGAADKNRRVFLAVLAVVFIMAGLSFAAVPLYDLFCRTTGFGGTPIITAQALPETPSARIITVKFNADTARDLLWDFRPQQREVAVHPGVRTLVAYSAKNNLAAPVTGTAVYNVTPPKAGKYFHKIECFCFGAQTLQPGQEATMPVAFYIDPAIDSDPGMSDVTTITLSYTFFKTESPALDKAMEDFYNQPSPGSKGDQS